MLILTRLEGQGIIIDNQIKIHFLGRIAKNKIRLGIEAPDEIKIERLEKNQKRHDTSLDE